MVRLPIFRIVFPFIAGILFQEYFPIHPIYSVISLAGFFLLGVAARESPMIRSLGLYLLLFYVGVFRLGLENHVIFSDKKTTLSEPILGLKNHWGVVTNRLSATSNYQRYIITCFDKEAVPYRSLVYLSGDEVLFPGQYLAFRSSLREIQKAEKYALFDYAKYMASKGVYWQTYIKEGYWVQSSPQSSFDFLLANWKHRLKLSLQERGVSQDHLALIFALTFGDKDMLSREIKTSFRDTGLMHIMAVSGLHVGLIYAILTALFMLLRLLIPMGLATSIWVVLLLLLGYVALAGFSPSVCRAFLMIALIEFRRIQFKRLGSPYGSVLLSALILLSYKPQWLFEVGFQLSYAAVFFILWLYPILSRKLRSDNKILDYFSQVTAVSLAAQCGVFTLSIFYFHQFSLLFYLGNILVSFFVPFLVLGSFLVMAVSSFPVFETLTLLFADFLGGFIWLVSFLATWDDLIFRDLYLTPFMALVLFVLLAMICLAMIYRFSSRYIYAVLICGLCFFSSYIWQDFPKLSSQEVLFFKDYKREVVSFRFGEELLVFYQGDSLFARKKTKDYRLRYGITKVSFLPWYQEVYHKEVYKTKDIIIFSGGVLSRSTILDSLVFSVWGDKDIFWLVTDKAHLPKKPEVLFGVKVLLPPSLSEKKTRIWSHFLATKMIPFVDLKKEEFNHIYRKSYFNNLVINL